MDGQRFDELTRAVAAGVSRRRILGIAAGAIAALRRGPTTAAPHACAVLCADQPGPRKASCREACRECDNNPAQVCQNPQTGAFTCCPEGQGCFEGICCTPEAVCFGPGGASCCPEGTFCCGEGVCCPFDDFCCFTPEQGIFCSSSLECPAPTVPSGCTCACPPEIECPEGEFPDPALGCACVGEFFCPPGSDFCSGPVSGCGGIESCSCFVDVEGNSRCADIGGQSCPAENECTTNADCPEGHVCFANEVCCGPGINDCLPLCGPGSGGAGAEAVPSYGA